MVHWVCRGRRIIGVVVPSSKDRVKMIGALSISKGRGQDYGVPNDWRGDNCSHWGASFDRSRCPRVRMNNPMYSGSSLNLGWALKWMLIRVCKVLLWAMRELWQYLADRASTLRPMSPCMRQDVSTGPLAGCARPGLRRLWLCQISGQAAAFICKNIGFLQGYRFAGIREKTGRNTCPPRPAA